MLPCRDVLGGGPSGAVASCPTLTHTSPLVVVVVVVCSHTGKDFFTAAEADDMLAFCLAFESEHGVRVNHETHRNRILYS